jgi:hypothetical protein
MNFRYLKRTPNIGLWYNKGAQFELIGYSDSDYVSYKVDRKNTPPVVVNLVSSLMVL